ncbi:TetR/AcrR family transcriptional regulator [Hominifimenecus sp. rT4P-3]|uniref:TetR/AcrR family transcriptional regulator n=1 Tax=Hominifimenecus sp. rT4P-3 TaxID=3242979 RepID=UPI003DA58670
MKEKEHVDLRVQKTLTAIHQTFEEMICEMEPVKITVKALAERAHIHRKTFYLHYESLDMLYEDTLLRIVDGYLEEMKKLPIPYSVRESTAVFFTYYSRQKPYVERLICHPSYQGYRDRLFFTTLMKNRARYFPYAKLPLEKQNVIRAFICSSTIEIYRQWIEDHKKMPLNEVIDLACTLLSNGTEGMERELNKF